MRQPRPLPLRTATRDSGSLDASRWRRWLLVLALAAAPLPLFAQSSGLQVGRGYFFQQPTFSFSLRGSYDRPNAGSDVFSFVTEQLTLNKGSFASGGISADIGIRVSDRTELVLSAGQSQRSAGSEFRKYVDNNDLPIEQVTRLRRTPISAGVRYALTAPGERISKFAWIPARLTPWIGAGAGMMNYTFDQKGDFVDFQTLNVFSDTYAAKGWAPMAYASVGGELRLSTRLSLMGDVRYTAARGNLNSTSGAFVGFDKIDLSGGAASLGLTVRM